MRIATMILALVAGMTLAAAPVMAAGSGPAMVTVSGAIQNVNRPPFDAFRDALFGVLGASFDRAFALSLADLQALPQTEIEVKYPNWPSAVRLRGPLLADVLAAAGATGKVVAVQAVDGYAPEFTMTEIAAGGFVLAIAADGEPLAVGGRGPAWLVYSPGSYGDQPVEDDSGLSWAVFHIQVKNAK